jgi:long-chain fatty acid transport protein
MLRGRSLGQAIGVVALVCATFGVSTASAQVDYEIMASLQFNFSNPGARSVEFRGFNFETPFVSGGRFNGTPTQLGVDRISGLTTGISDNQTHSLSFVSAVVPKSRFAFAIYRTEVANFETNVQTTGAFFDDPDIGVCTASRSDLCVRVRPVIGNLDLKVSNFGGSAAIRLSDQVSVGVGVSLYDFEIDSVNRRYDIQRLPQTAAGGFFGEPLNESGNVVATEFISGEDTAVGINVGASINPNEKVRIGASYRQGPKFDIAYRRENRNGDLINGDESKFRIPDVIAVGVLLKPVDALNVTVDFRRVQYSQLTSEMKAGFIGVDPDDYVVDDGNEIRAAGEYLFTNLPAPLSAIAIRGGVWHDPDHRIRYEGAFSPDTVLFPAGDSEIHYTGGAGVVFDKVQFDLGFDRSETVKTFSVSAVLRF